MLAPAMAIVGVVTAGSTASSENIGDNTVPGSREKRDLAQWDRITEDEPELTRSGPLDSGRIEPRELSIDGDSSEGRSVRSS